MVGRRPLRGGPHDVDVYVTADLRHHPALEERETTRGMYLVDAGHWASEHVWLASGAAASSRGCERRVVWVGHRHLDPAHGAWTFVVGANAANES